MHMIFLVDGDNHLSEGLQGIDLLTPQDTVLIFYGRGQALAPIQRMCAGTRAKVQYLESVRSGKNSIDFQIITELGVLVGRGEAEFAYVISQDKGYQSAISALRQRYASTFKEVGLQPSIESCVQAAFLLRPDSKEQLSRSLEETYGPTWGALVYQHLRELFAETPRKELAKPEPEKQKKSASRRKKKPLPRKEKSTPMEATVVEGLEDVQIIDTPQPPKRTHRAGRRHRKAKN